MTTEHNMTTQTTANRTLTTTRATIGGRRYEVVTYRGRRVELYEEYADQPGLLAFVGYLEEVLPLLPATAARDLAPLFEAHEKAHAAFWAEFLLGASTWA